MKTQNNNQETETRQVSNKVIRTSAVLAGVLFFSLSLNAQDFWEQYFNPSSYGMMTLTMDEQLAENSNADAAVEIINSALTYHLNFLNENYTAPESEEQIEVENWMTDQAYFVGEEELNNENATLELVENARDIMMEPALEEKLTIENWMTDETFFVSVEQITKEGEAIEIEKYAEKTVNSVESEKALAIEGWMTDEGFFTEAEQSTAEGVDQEIARYADSIVNSEETEGDTAIENWMLDTDNFSNVNHYNHLAVN